MKTTTAMRLRASILFLFSILTYPAFSQCDELFFSEYLEGSSNNKAIEIFNPTNDPIDLSSYSVRLYSDGSSAPSSSLTLNGIIAPGQVYVIAHGSAGSNIQAMAQVTSAVAGFDGDDAVGLYNNTTLIDLIGQIGVDPGTSWTAGSGATADYTLVRKETVNSGDTSWSKVSGQWYVYQQDSTDFLGIHQMNVCGPSFPLKDVATATFNVQGNVPLYKDSSVELRGIVFTANFDTNKLSFFLYDNTGGVHVESAKQFGYDPQFGDSIFLTGTIGFSNGLTQILPDTIILLSALHPIKPVQTYTALSEFQEGEFIRLMNMYLADTSQWEASGDFNVDITNGKDTFVMEIHGDVMGSVTRPEYKFHVSGAGSQFDDTSPYTQGYRILPRHVADIEEIAFVKPKPYFIFQIKDLDVNFVPDSVNRPVRLKGIVSGANFTTAGLEFFFQDLTGGMAVISQSKDFGYTPVVGDSVYVEGELFITGGLTHVMFTGAATDTVQLISQGHSLTPALIHAPDEVSEGRLVRMENIRLVNPAQWDQIGTGQDATVEVTTGQYDFSLVFDGDLDWTGLSKPFGKFDITGIGSQYDPTSPYSENYIILPRRPSDISMIRQYDISELDANDPDGSPLLLDSLVSISGMVSSPSYTPGMLEFSLYDATGGVFIYDTAHTFGYTPAMGDSIALIGKVSFMNGRTFVSFGSSARYTLALLSQGNSLMSPVVVTALDESAEGELITFKNATLVNAAQWQSSGTFTVAVTNGVDTLQVLIDGDLISGQTAPASAFDVTGIGSQSDSASPFSEGYILWPRDWDDFDFTTGIAPISLPQMVIYPNPATDMLTIRSETPIQWLTVTDMLGKELMSIPVGKSSATIDVSGLEKGVYFIRASDGSRSAISKFLKQ